MLKVGLTGGYATGKSFVAQELERLGCHVIYADRLGHSALEPGGEAYAPAIELFGPSILQPDGLIDRKKVATLAFSNPVLLERLTSYVHPAVFRLEESMLQAIQRQDPTGIAVLEAAILIETGRHAAFDRIILTTCDPETQIARGMKRDGVSREEAMRRIARQMSLAEKRPHADYVIETDGSKTDTIHHIQSIFRELRSLADHHQS